MIKQFTVNTSGKNNLGYVAIEGKGSDASRMHALVHRNHVLVLGGIGPDSWKNMRLNFLAQVSQSRLCVCVCVFVCIVISLSHTRKHFPRLFSTMYSITAGI